MSALHLELDNNAPNNNIVVFRSMSMLSAERIFYVATTRESNINYKVARESCIQNFL